MGKKLFLPIILLAGVLLTAAAEAGEPIGTLPVPNGAKVASLSGEATIRCSGDDRAVRLVKGDEVAAGCQIATGSGGRLELLLPDKSIVRFAEKTTFVLVEARAEKTGFRDVRLLIHTGKIWSKVRKALSGSDRFELLSQNAVAGVRGTVYRMDVLQDQSAIIKVYEGKVVVSSPRRSEAAILFQAEPVPVEGPRSVPGPEPVSMEQWSYLVGSRQQILVAADGTAGRPGPIAEDPDEWVKWNTLRDKKDPSPQEADNK